MVNQFGRLARLGTWVGCSLTVALSACSGTSPSDDGSGGSVSLSAGAPSGVAAGSSGTSNTGGGQGGGGAATGGVSSAGGKATGGATALGGAASSGGAGAGGTAGRGGAGSSASGGAGGAGCNVAPVDPDATQPARNLLCYLYSISGNHVLSGQQETSWSNPADDISFYTGNSSIGKAPAVLGGD